MGFTCTFLLGRAGEPIRPVLIARKNSLSVPGMFGVYVLERLRTWPRPVRFAALALLLFRHHDTAGAASTVVTKMRSGGAVLFAWPDIRGRVSGLLPFSRRGVAGAKN